MQLRVLGGKICWTLVNTRWAPTKPRPCSQNQNFPAPNSIKELQRFIGTVNYYRSYIRNMAATAEPLNRLTRKDTPWNWTADCQLTLDTLRETLATESFLLRYPKWTQPFIVEADASSVAIAAFPSQHEPTTVILQPISYFSSALSETEINYSAGQREA